MEKIKSERTLLANVANSQLARYYRNVAQQYARRYRLEFARTMRKLNQEEANGNG